MTARTPQPVRTPQFAIKAKDFIKKGNSTFLKMGPSMEGSFSDIKFSSEDLPLLVTRIDRDLMHGTEEHGWKHGHWEIEMAVPIDGRYNWYVWPEHVEEAPLPEFFIQGTTLPPTTIKHRLDANLSPEDMFQFDKFDQPLQVKWIKPAGDSKHIEFELLRPVKGKYNWFAFAEHVVPSKILSTVNA